MDVTQQSGEEWVVRCPYPERHKHGDNNPSCGINVRSGAWLCFSCGARGGIKHLEKLYRSKAIGGVDDDVLLSLREEMQERMARPSVEQANVYPESWLNQFDVPHDYWQSRGFSKSFAEQWRLGYDPIHDAATIPLRALDRRVIGVIRRSLAKDAKPRYKYPKSFRLQRYIWGAWENRSGDLLVVTEGSVDALAVWQAGIPAVALLGSHVSDHQARILRSLGARTIVSALDNDRAGQRATHELHEALPGVQHLVVWDFGKKAKDIAELGVPQRKSAIRSAEPYHFWRTFPGVLAPPKPGRVGFPR